MKKYLIPALITSLLLILAVGISMQLGTLLDSHVCGGACSTSWAQYMSLLWGIVIGLIALFWTLFTTISAAEAEASGPVVGAAVFPG
jgi:hypothetical protein